MPKIDVRLAVVRIDGQRLQEEAFCFRRLLSPQRNSAHIVQGRVKIRINAQRFLVVADGGLPVAASLFLISLVELVKRPGIERSVVPSEVQPVAARASGDDLTGRRGTGCNRLQGDVDLSLATAPGVYHNALTRGPIARRLHRDVIQTTVQITEAEVTVRLGVDLAHQNFSGCNQAYQNALRLTAGVGNTSGHYAVDLLLRRRARR